ncbi:hypothetical protein KFL_004620130 [Klebsormidium nitens]|uniref:MYND-type domain-containing protein n=1 Tax=Klebsormidium nitens TaxID=105231 RepID=A0A1Y1IE12_KLENI|nr:hypothetical protein KFL_004620130 [Klebsormidium nitens]|eukprot:GAQ88833.1 hypothetical protein KFL_004620130 [Klebsormidium nitens]
MCLTEHSFVEKLARSLQKSVARIEVVSAFPREIICTLQGICSFAHASKVFRQCMQAIHMNLLPAVQRLFSEDYIFLSEDDLYASTESLARLIETLALSSDSRVWMINAGYLQVLAELFRSERLTNETKEQVVNRCALSLLRLFESKECLKAMRETDVLSLLKPYSSLLDNKLPNFWRHVESKLLDDAYSKIEALAELHPILKSLRRADFAIPTVCSWSGCTALESVSTPTFSKCGRCGVVPYCSKEHQKLHWPAHKDHCLPKGAKPFGH